MLSVFVVLLLYEFVVHDDINLSESMWVMDDLIWLTVLCTWNEEIRWNIMFVVWCVVGVWKWECNDILFYVTSCLQEWWYVEMREWWKLNIIVVWIPLDVLKMLCAKRKCYVRKENAMCAMKRALMRCYVRKENAMCEMKQLCARLMSRLSRRFT